MLSPSKHEEALSYQRLNHFMTAAIGADRGPCAGFGARIAPNMVVGAG